MEPLCSLHCGFPKFSIETYLRSCQEDFDKNVPGNVPGNVPYSMGNMPGGALVVVFGLGKHDTKGCNFANVLVIGLRF